MKLKLSVLSILAGCVFCSASAFADTAVTTLSVAANNPTFSITRTSGATTTFTPITLTGALQDYPLSYSGVAPQYTIQNAGSDSGWSVSLQLAGLTGSGLPTLGAAYGGVGSVSPAYIATALSSTTDAGATVLQLVTGQKVVTADAVPENGKSFTYALGNTWSLKDVPADAPDGTYAGILTVTATQTP